MKIKIKKLIYLLYRILLVGDRIPERFTPGAVVFSCHDVDRSMVENEKYFSPLFEGVRALMDGNDYNYINLSHPYATIPGKLIKGDSVLINHLMLATRIRVMCGRLFLAKKKSEYRVELETKLYLELLKRIAPKIIFSIQPPLGLCKAARSLDVFVVELMHANNLSKVDKVFSDHMSLPDEVLPNVIVSFDECTYNTVSDLCAGRDVQSLISTDPWYHYFQFNNKVKEKMLKRAHGGKISKNVLITLQWGYDGERESLSDIIPNGILHPELEAVLVHPLSNNTSFHIRMHPIQRLRPWYKHHLKYIELLSLRFKNIEVSKASNTPLPILLEEMDCHITMSSCCTGEAAVEKIPSLLLCPTLDYEGCNFGMFRELESTDNVTFGRLDRAEIIDWIESCGIRNKALRAKYDVNLVQLELAEFYSKLIEKQSFA